MAWQDSRTKRKAKRRFFTERDPVELRKAARAFVDMSPGSGFELQPGGIIVESPSGSHSQPYAQYVARQMQSRQPGTAMYKRHLEEYNALWDQMLVQGPLGEAGFFTARAPDGGTDLYWTGYDYKGRYAKRPFRLASMAKANASLADFEGGSSGYMIDPNLRENVLRDRFDEFYRLVMGEGPSTAPNPQEQDAIDYRDQLVEAGEILNGRTEED